MNTRKHTSLRSVHFSCFVQNHILDENGELMVEKARTCIVRNSNGELKI